VSHFKKAYIRKIILLVLFFSFIPYLFGSDTIVTKQNKKYRGKVIKITDKGFVIRTDEGTVIVLPKSSVTKIYRENMVLDLEEGQRYRIETKRPFLPFIVLGVATGAYAVHEFQNYQDHARRAQDKLEELREREAGIEWLLKKYQVTDVSALIKRHEEMKRSLDELEDFDEKIEELEKNLDSMREQLQNLSLDLSQRRQDAGKKFEAELEVLLDSVGLPNATFKVNQSWLENKEGMIAIQDKRYELSENGLDKVEFNIGLNVGEPARPLHKVASGGEVSRIMLCIKTLLADSDDISTLVFDEIDSGISGRFAQIVGKKMLEIAKHHQLIVITHLPQIAAQGESHFSVAKQEKEGRTNVSVQKLKTDERIIDIAKLLGGEQVTPQAIANAKELLEMSIDMHENQKTNEILKI